MKAKMPAPSDRLLPLMFEMGRLLRGALAENLAPLSLLHFETLRFVSEAKNPTMRDIAGYLKIAAPSATDIVNSLVRAKCLVRRADPEDRRKIRLSVSASGARVLKRAHAGKLRAFAHVVAPLRPQDRQELIRILSVITHRS